MDHSGTCAGRSAARDCREDSKSDQEIRGRRTVFLIGREEIPDGLLRLFWNREMGLVTQNSLLLNLEEIRQMIGQYGSRIAPEQLLEYTGGWSGVVDVILRLEQKYGDWQPQTHW